MATNSGEMADLEFVIEAVDARQQLVALLVGHAQLALAVLRAISTHVVGKRPHWRLHTASNATGDNKPAELKQKTRAHLQLKLHSRALLLALAHLRQLRVQCMQLQSPQQVTQDFMCENRLLSQYLLVGVR